MPFFPRPRQLKIPRAARVLEVGSGGRPHCRSTVLLDRFALDSSHREGKRLVRDRRPLVVADGEHLPFSDKSFDYCICMHVLEHVENPERLLREMERVAHAGYIETPSELFDWLFAAEPYIHIHKWFVRLDRHNTAAPATTGLVLRRKTPETSTHRHGELLDYLRREDPWFERWLEKRPHLFTVQYEWHGQIRFRIEDPAEAPAPLPPAQYLGRSLSTEPFYWGSGLWGLKRWLYARAVHPRLRKFLKRLLR